MRRVTVLHAAVIPAVLFWTAPACSADTPAPPSAPSPSTPYPSTPGEQARQGLDLLMKALEGWVRQMPLFAPPEVTPEGDIIIRRLDRNHPPSSPSVPPAPPPQGGATPGSSSTDL